MRLLSLSGYIEFRRLRRNYRMLGITHEQVIVHCSPSQIAEKAKYLYGKGWVLTFHYESGPATILMFKPRLTSG